MRSILAGLRQLVIPWGAGSGADRIEIGGTLPADLVAFYATFSITLVGGTVMYKAPNEYSYSVLGYNAGGLLRWHNGVRNTQGITDAMTLTPFSLSRQAFIEFGILPGDIVNLIVSNTGSELKIDDGAELNIVGANTAMAISTGADLTIDSTAGQTTIDNTTVFDGGSITEINGEVEAPTLRHVNNIQNTASTTTSATYGNLTNIAGVAFDAPRSGIVTIYYTAQMQNSAANGASLLTPWVGTGSTVGAGTQVLAASDNNALSFLQHATVSEFLRYGGQYTLTGLTPGATYNVSMRGRAVTAGTSTFERIHTTVVPSP